MEDGIEMYKSSFLNLYSKKQEQSNQKYIYIHTKKYGTGEYKMFDDEESAIDFSIDKKCRVDIFINEVKGCYRPTNEYFLNGIKYASL